MKDNLKKIIVLGGGGHSKVIIDILHRLGNIEILGFLDDNEKKDSILNIKRIGNLFPIKKINETCSLILGLGHIGNTELREKVSNQYTKAGHKFEKVIAPTSIINSEVALGKGVVICDGAILQPGVFLGDFSIINTRASVDHDCIIGKHVHIAPGVTISGNVKIGDKVLIGTGASIIQGIEIAEGCIIGAGAIVINNCDIKGGVYVGNPAKLIKTK